jgi:hypothetical protein
VIGDREQSGVARRLVDFSADLAGKDHQDLASKAIEQAVFFGMGWHEVARAPAPA